MSRFAAFLLVAFVAGCGGSNQTPSPSPSPTPAPPGPAAQPASPAADLYEMDPTKHAPPATPVAGRLGGKPFTPDKVELQGEQLTFRQGKDFFADNELVINLKVDKGGSVEGTKVVVQPSQKWHEGNVPSLTTATRKGEDLPDTKFVTDGYSLTLELGKKANGKVSGKVHVCLPDAGRSYLAGSFEAAVLRAIDDPPTADDAPFVRGTVTLPDAKGKALTVGYVELAGKEMVSDLVGTSVPGVDDTGGWVQSASSRPRVSTLLFDKGVPKFEFVKLPPGKYLVFARVKNGPVAWATVEVKAGGQVTQDIKFDLDKVGAVEVTVPADFKGDVRLAPADVGVPGDQNVVAGRVASSLELGAEAKGGKATVTNVPPGKYILFTVPGVVEPKGTVEVTAGQTAKAEIKK